MNVGRYWEESSPHNSEQVGIVKEKAVYRCIKVKVDLSIFLCKYILTSVTIQYRIESAACLRIGSQYCRGSESPREQTCHTFSFQAHTNAGSREAALWVKLLNFGIWHKEFPQSKLETNNNLLVDPRGHCGPPRRGGFQSVVLLWVWGTHLPPII